ncbi:hypothetical protein ACR2VE_28130, partial [Klebsiella pneumoniae]
VALTKAGDDNLAETYNSIQARQDEINALDATIAQYETLQSKNKLSTDEVLRYMDVMDELKGAKSDQAIKALTDEQNKLLEKSGLTNEEMEDFLELNDKIIDKSPTTVKAISDQGNAYADNLEALKKLNAAERERLTDQTYLAITDEMDKQTKNLEKQKELQGDIKVLEKERDEALG